MHIYFFPSFLGMGSYPLSDQGWHLNILFNANTLPFKDPHSLITSIAYWEQVGSYLQFDPNNGDKTVWYPLMSVTKNKEGIFCIQLLLFEIFVQHASLNIFISLIFTTLIWRIVAFHWMIKNLTDFYGRINLYWLYAKNF